MNNVVGVAVLNTGDDQQLRGRDCSTCSPVLLKARLTKIPVMFGHQHDAVSAARKLCGEVVQTPSGVIRPLGMDVAGRSKGHRPNPRATMRRIVYHQSVKKTALSSVRQL